MNLGQGRVEDVDTSNTMPLPASHHHPSTHENYDASVSAPHTGKKVSGQRTIVELNNGRSNQLCNHDARRSRTTQPIVV